MRASFEKIPTEAATSWTLLNRRLPEAIPFEWHHHPEYELTLTLNSRGHRYISNDVALYDDGDLVLVGPNVPHSWSSVERIDLAKPHVALVIWFSEAWAESLVQLFPEMTSTRTLLAAAQQALSFSDSTSRSLRPLIEAMVEQDAAQRLISLLTVLTTLSRDVAAQRIAVENAPPQVAEDARIRRVLDYVHGHYAQPLSMPELAQMACVSVSAFHRMFRKHTRCTALDYIVRLRIGHACALLMQGNLAINTIAEHVGYASQALFNRQFKAQKGITPTQFREQHGHHFQ
ncbi:helix-turn-helix transcriptional regulator [Pseudomonas reactans]|uniref:helix-turn-helix domain-containing protein n=1 Tax=Pseudomonas reactans TaxID=117680 RepID=UPI0015A09C1B|nr:AraC family transcriptional regulator [Pseudomonas reactans]NWC90610.1 helix-turn-helix transcriptional regulator [Pseudomonas reactans]NWD32623.1 helix-turn-helix transcriptional regulator [Pseudomonas reactans]NWF15078.1 helix-turn-helix transcriptional regulator [Pseudomonas reactans]